MKRLIITIVLWFVCLLFSPGVKAGWVEDVEAFLEASDGANQKNLIDEIIKARPNWEDLVEHLAALSFAPVEPGLYLDTITCIDGVNRPYVVSIPEGYNPGVSTPPLVYLHGMVGREVIIPDQLKHAEEHPFVSLGNREGWIVLLPFGQRGAAWWERVGYTNIHDLVRNLKSKYNIDDDRVWMGGFSDGASGSFFHAMCLPTDFASFLALNGHMGVASLDNDQPLYAGNMATAPVFAITTDKDHYYPTERMKPSFETAIEAGAEIMLRSLPGEHTWEDIKEEAPNMLAFLKRHPRDPLPAKFSWETGDVENFGQCRWFVIDEISTAQPEMWHHDYNTTMIDSTITFGFVNDDTFEGEGMKVGSVNQDKSFMAFQMGLKAGDIIIAGNDIPILADGDIGIFKGTLQWGDSVYLRVIRGEKEVLLKGRLPQPRKYLLFKREVPSAKAEIEVVGNDVNIRTSRVGAFRILVHPDMFRVNRNIKVTVNERVMFDDIVKPDIGFMLGDFRENRDCELIYINEIKIVL